ncbi:hypothetical protein SAMN04488020_103186 [Palleronia marisminoris]|uniref:Glycosyltransferase RgtA/B/C/D-like domain-containing protein n=1 Tax=Palleronia marisminoris TaxID=315423 RepID=A0A1Y5S8P7_9RHOB|nr:hypothetical protein [Palleronia marisminoris]SFG68486.1 hypothetical protein SAMN04488020_103186 [Palleronia marisminoris]SLN35034.1 hypothetical protein PAM7066_01466 [Palleronia marisminoris]
MSAVSHIGHRAEPSRLARGAWALAAVCLFLAIAIRIATGEVTADENALATLASQLGQMRLYDQIEFSRGPLVALYLQAVHALAGGSDPVLAIRAGVIVAWAVSAIVMWKVALRVSESPMMAFLCLAAVMANGYLLEGRGSALLAASLCVAPLAAAYAFHQAAVAGPGRIRSAFASGFAFGLAIAVAPSLAIVYSALLLGSLISPRNEDPVVRLTRIAVPSAIGMAVGTLPLTIYWAADPIAVEASLLNPVLAQLEHPFGVVLHEVDLASWLPALLLAIVVVALGLTRRPRVPMLPSDGVPIVLACATVSAAGFVATSGALPELATAAFVALAVAAASWWPSVRPTAIGAVRPVILVTTVAMAVVAVLPLASQVPHLADRVPSLMVRIGLSPAMPGARDADPGFASRLAAE